jgi:hypothetical protein
LQFKSQFRDFVDCRISDTATARVNRIIPDSSVPAQERRWFLNFEFHIHDFESDACCV